MYCRRGDMGLSRKMEEAFTQRYAVDAPIESSEPLFNPRIHGGLHWYCPGCGEALNSHLECEHCHGHLRDLVFQLVELHPHRALP